MLDTLRGQGLAIQRWPEGVGRRASIFMVYQFSPNSTQNRTFFIGESPNHSASFETIAKVLLCATASSIHPRPYARIQRAVQRTGHSSDKERVRTLVEPCDPRRLGVPSLALQPSVPEGEEAITKGWLPLPSRKLKPCLSERDGHDILLDSVD